MRLFELSQRFKLDETPNNNLIKQIINSMVLTILDPTLKGARKSDCYSFCARAIRNDEVPDDAEFAIYGSGNHPAHGVIQKDGDILIDVFGNHRTMFKGGILKYKVEGHGMSEHPLTVIYKIPVSELKNMVMDKYKSMRNGL